ncbi:MAG: MFS transporter [Dehalococcoidia bacterium]|nr:MFS transporter [Dehalococcoidia bacterium]
MLSRLASADLIAPLRYKNYFLLWSGQGAHAFALWGEQIARPFLVFFLVEGKEAQAVALGAVIAVRTLPQLFFGVFAGVISDWFDHRKILLFTKVGVVALSVVFAALLVFGIMEMWHVYAFSFIRGSMMAFDQPARQAMIANIVPENQMTRAVALMSATQNIMRIVGASAGGFAVAFLGLTGTFVAIAVIYTGAVMATWFIKVPFQKKPAESGARAMAAGLVEGARYAWANKPIRGILLMSLVYFTFGMSYIQVFAPIFANEVISFQGAPIGSGGLGIMTALTGAGALIGAVVVASRQPARVGLLLPLVVMGFGAMLIAFSAATYLPGAAGLIVPFILLGGTGILQTAYFSMSNAALLAAAPAEMRGRVISLLSLDRAMVTLGASGAGFLTAAMGVQLAQIAYGVVCVVGGLFVVLFFRELRAARMEGSFGFSTGRHAPEPAAAPAATVPVPAIPEPNRPART